MDPNYLDFEQPIAELEAKIRELRLVGTDNDLNISEEIQNLQGKSTKLTERSTQISVHGRFHRSRDTLCDLTPWILLSTYLQILMSCTETGCLPTIWQLSEALPGLMADRSWLSVTKKVEAQERYAITLACRDRKDTAKPGV